MPLVSTGIHSSTIEPHPHTPDLAAPRVVVDTARKQMQMAAQQHSTTTISRVLMGTANHFSIGVGTMGVHPLETGNSTNEGTIGMFIGNIWERFNKDLKFETTTLVIQASIWCEIETLVAAQIFRRMSCVMPVPLCRSSDDPADPAAPRHMKTPSLASGYATCRHRLRMWSRSIQTSFETCRNNPRRNGGRVCENDLSIVYIRIIVLHTNNNNQIILIIIIIIINILINIKTITTIITSNYHSCFLLSLLLTVILVVILIFRRGKDLYIYIYVNLKMRFRLANLAS